MARMAVWLAAALLWSGLGFPAAEANMAPPLDEFRLGFTLAPGNDGPRVVKVEPGSVADAAGIKTGDVILAINQRYAKRLSRKEIKAFAAEPHVWPVELIVVQGGRDVRALRLEPGPQS